MLGVNSPREPITKEFSQKIRAALWRSTTGNLTDDEKAVRQKSREARQMWGGTWQTK